jgi:hypothetical protein
MSDPLRRLPFRSSMRAPAPTLGSVAPLADLGGLSSGVGGVTKIIWLTGGPVDDRGSGMTGGRGE